MAVSDYFKIVPVGLVIDWLLSGSNLQMVVLVLIARQKHKIFFSSPHVNRSMSDSCDREDNRENVTPTMGLPLTSWVLSGKGPILVGFCLLILTRRVIVPLAGCEGHGRCSERGQHSDRSGNSSSCCCHPLARVETSPLGGGWET